MSESLYNEAIKKYEQEDYQGCIDALEQAVRENPFYHEAYAKAGEILAEIGQLEYATNAYSYAVRLNPESLTYKQSFVDVASCLTFDDYNEDRKETLLLCLEDRRVNVSALGVAWFSHLRRDPKWAAFLEIAISDDYKSFAEKLPKLLERLTLTDPYFLWGLKRLVVMNLAFERFLTRLRRAFLSLHSAHQISTNEDNITNFISALSHYAYAVDYIFYVDEKEHREAQDLIAQIESDNSVSKLTLALSACYMPLGQLKNAKDIQKRFSDGPLRNVVQAQIADMLDREGIDEKISILTPVEDQVSKAVKVQYEECPYPRWSISQHEHQEFKECEDYEEKDIVGNVRKILNAGCGTGEEAITLSGIFPEAEILAIDLSKSSLSYAIQKAKQLGIQNITFKQADILKLTEHEERYDFISSMGVLHHMEDPVKGWKILTDLLKPKGYMRIGLYSHHGRQSIRKVRQLLSDRGYTGTAEEIRNFRNKAAELLDETTYKDITWFRDYYFLPECRDLLFHVQEHQFTIPQISKTLAALGLEFRGFQFAQGKPHDYDEQYPDDPDGLSLDNWAEYEEKNPKTFALMYRFFCQKR